MIRISDCAMSLAGRCSKFTSRCNDAQKRIKSRFLKIDVGGKIGRVLTRPVSPGLIYISHSNTHNMWLNRLNSPPDIPPPERTLSHMSGWTIFYTTLI